MKIFIKFKLVSVTKAGDYYQILFHDDLDTEDEPYFMIQRQFEFPDGGVCHFESHNEKLIEHCKAKSVSLSRNRLSLSYGEGKSSVEMWKLSLVCTVLIFKNWYRR